MPSALVHKPSTVAQQQLLSPHIHPHWASMLPHHSNKHEKIMKFKSIWMWTAKNRYFPHRSWKLCTTYSKGGGRGEGGLSSKIRPCVEELFLAYLLSLQPEFQLELSTVTVLTVLQVTSYGDCQTSEQIYVVYGCSMVKAVFYRILQPWIRRYKALNAVPPDCFWSPLYYLSKQHWCC